MELNKVAVFFGFLLIATGAGSIWLATALMPSDEVTAVSTPAGPPLEGDMSTFDLSPSPSAAPDISFSDLSGNTLGLDDFRGQVVLVNYWATWCAPCLRELPSLERMEAAVANPEFRLLAISIDREGAAKVGPFLDENDFGGLPAYLDPSGLSAVALGVLGMPTTILFDREGREIGRYTGATEWDEPEAVALIRHFLES